eukprot:3562248-Pyramimonas_sp.AAC.1
MRGGRHREQDWAEGGVKHYKYCEKAPHGREEEQQPGDGGGGGGGSRKKKEKKKKPALDDTVAKGRARVLAALHNDVEEEEPSPECPPPSP